MFFARMVQNFQVVLLLSFFVVHSRAFLSGVVGHGFRPTHFSSVLSAKGSATSEIGFDVLSNKNVLVVGGSGRVGGSVVTQLLKHGAKITVGATRVEKYEDSKRRWMEMFPTIDTTTIDFAKVDRESVDSVHSVLKSKDFDLVVHTAGPFQGKAKTPNGVIDASVANGVPYVDVCDDYCTASAAKAKFLKKAQDSQVPCIISTGCWVSWHEVVSSATG
jgi:shikimate 5-dehydrogenase